MIDPWVALKHLKSVALANDDLDDLLDIVLYRLRWRYRRRPHRRDGMRWPAFACATTTATTPA
jgi:hypothetical protein